jgi:hypothetical protein
MKALQITYIGVVAGLIAILAGCVSVGALQGTPPALDPQFSMLPTPQVNHSLSPTCPPGGATEPCFRVLTPLPYQGIRISPPTELILVEEAATRSSVHLFSMALSGNTLVGATKESGQIKLYAINLNSGQMQQIGTSDPGVAIMHTSAQYAVWNRGVRDVFAYDLQTGKETHIALGAYPDVSGSIVVWVDWRNVEQGDSANIYGYDLKLGQEFPVVMRPGAQTQPKIVGQWIAYLAACWRGNLVCLLPTQPYEFCQQNEASIIQIAIPFAKIVRFHGGDGFCAVFPPRFPGDRRSDRRSGKLSPSRHAAVSNSRPDIPNSIPPRRLPTPAAKIAESPRLL